MSPVFLSFFLCFVSLFIYSSSISTFIDTTTLTLNPISTPKHTSNPWDHFTALTKSSLYRAHHLKNTTITTSPTFHGISSSPLNARSYGGYSVSLSFGTPPQPIPLVFDTGSSLLWVPCTSRYKCSKCTFSGIDPSTIPTFKPNLSSTIRIVGCRNPKCGFLFGSDNIHTRCPNCPDRKNCTLPCPAYVLEYGLGSTGGIAMTDNLDLPGRVLPRFFFGCSIISSRQPQGIAGFGRAPSSVPNQLKLNKFSYCLLSHKLDDKPKSSDLILTGKQHTPKVPNLTYTSFGKNPRLSPYDEYYYVNLRKISVDNKRVKLPYKYLVPNPNGNGGVIVDSGTTLTFMDQAILEPLVKAIAAGIRHLERDRDVEARSGFGLCYNVSNRDDSHVYLPGLALHFKGGAKMELSLDNYFSFVSTGSLCLTIISGSTPAGPSVPVGPAMIIGNYLQQNFYIEYDLVNNKFGFKKHKCG